MALPSGNFSSGQTGRLQVVFSGQFYTQSGSDWGNGTALELVIRCKLGAGADLQTGVLRLSAGHNSVTLERDYVGGSGNVAVAFEYVSHNLSGPSTVGFSKARVSCYLIKR
jgi:predicted heme/steroid binding protein